VFYGNNNVDPAAAAGAGGSSSYSIANKNDNGGRACSTCTSTTCDINNNNNPKSSTKSRANTKWATLGFCIWGAGRDGKDFLKALSPAVASKVVCFVDVDEKKITEVKWYENPELDGGRRIPILHFSVLAKEDGCKKEEEVVLVLVCLVVLKSNGKETSLILCQRVG